MKDFLFKHWNKIGAIIFMIGVSIVAAENLTISIGITVLLVGLIMVVVGWTVDGILKHRNNL